MQSLLDLILRLLGGDEELATAYERDPAGFADKYFGDLSDEDWNDLNLVLDQSGIVQRNIETGSNVVYVDKTAGSDSDEDYKSDYQDDSNHAVAQLHNIVNNYSYVDDRDTVIDQSTTQVINTGGGDFWQRIDNVSATAAGDGAVAAGDDVKGDVHTGPVEHTDNSTNTISDDDTTVRGDGNLVGDYNDVVGNGSTVDKSVDNEIVDIDTGDIYIAGGDIDSSQDNDGIDDSFNNNELSSDDDKISDNDTISTDHSSKHDVDVVVEDSAYDNSTTTQEGLLNVNDVLSHNNAAVDIEIPIDLL